MKKNDAAQPYVIPRASLTWLLVSHIAVVIPHVTRIPLWMTAISVLCVAWRVLVFRQRAAFPGKWIKNLLVAGALGGILFHYRTLLGAEAGTSLLLVMFDLKLLEMFKRRDAYVVVVLAYFVSATQFMFSTTLFAAVYGFLAMTLITAALLGLHQNSTHRNPLRTAKLAGVITLQAVPLMLCLFYLFPRLPPLWQMDQQQKRAKLGFSEEMSPGDISEIGKSDELAFRAEFSGNIVPAKDLYWRGAVLSQFDGHKWKVTDPARVKSIAWIKWAEDRSQFSWKESVIKKQDSILEYSIVMEPHNSKWLFGLDIPFIQSDDIGLTREFTLIRRQPVTDTIKYNMASYRQYVIDSQLEPEFGYLNTQLPATSNPRARQMAAKLFAKSGNDPKRFIVNVLRWYHTDNFTYTLKPPKLSGDSVDEFLFTTQRGFCEHFSSATAFLARSVGIPARVVVGYQGGEWNELGKHYLIHQYDAHAWTEVWLSGEGWVRVDGTAAVSPERIEKGMDSALGSERSAESSPLDGIRLKHVPVLGKLRLVADYVDFAWSKYVLNFDSDSQMRLFSQLFGGFDSQRVGLIIFLICGGVTGLVSVLIFSGSSETRLEPSVRLYRKFCTRLAEKGYERALGETPNAFAARVAREVPMIADAIMQFTNRFSALSYTKLNSAQEKTKIKELEQSLTSLSKQLKKI